MSKRNRRNKQRIRVFLPVFLVLLMAAVLEGRCYAQAYDFSRNSCPVISYDTVLKEGSAFGNSPDAFENASENGLFYMDSERLYGAMVSLAGADGKVTVNSGNPVYIPWIFKSKELTVDDDFIRITLEFDKAVSSQVKNLSYELMAKRTVSRTDAAKTAYLVEWRPELMAGAAGAADVLVTIKAYVKGSNGSVKSVVEKGTLHVIFKSHGSIPDETTEPDETLKPDETSEQDVTSKPDETSMPDESSESETKVPDSGKDDGNGGGNGESGNGNGQSEGPGGEGTDESGGGNGGSGESDDPGDINGGGDSPVTWTENGGMSGGNGGGSGGSGEETPDPAAKIRLIECTVDKEEIHPGDRVTVNAVLKNGSPASAIKDLRIVYESTTGEVLPVNPINSIYVDNIGAGHTYEISFPLDIGFALTSDSQKINLTFEYTDKSAAALSSSETVFLKITPSFDFKVDQPSMAASVAVYTSQDITLNVYNTGDSTVKNVICTLEMPGVTAAGSAFGGDVAAGESKTVILKTLIGKLDNEDEKKAYGQSSGVIYVQYEDEGGKVYNQEVSVTTQITLPEGETAQEEIPRSSQWWISIVCGLVAVQVVAFIIMGVNRRRRV